MDELPADAVYDFRRPTDVAVSPDGEYVAIVVSEAAPEEDEFRQSVFVLPTDGSRDPHRLSRASGAWNIEWSPDGSQLGVVMVRDDDLALRVGRDNDGETDEPDTETDDETAEATDPDADDGPKPQVWVYDLELGGDARQVTKREHGVRDFDWGPAGERLVVSARDPTDEEQAYLEQRQENGPIETERLQHKFDGEGWLDTVTTYLFVVDVDTRQEHRLDDAHGGGIFESMFGLQPAWHPTDDRVAFCAYHGENGDDTNVYDVHIVDIESDEVEQVTSGEYSAVEPTWSPDGERLAFGAQNPENPYVPGDVCVAEAPDDYRVVTAGLDRTISRPGAPTWVDDTTLLASIGDEGRTRFVRLDATGGHERVFDRQRNDEAHRQFDVGGGTVAAVRSHSSEGTDVYAMPVDGLDVDDDGPDPRRQLTALNDGVLAEYAHPETTRLTVESDDGTEVECIAHYPPEFDPLDPDPRPTLLWIHGGPMAYDEPGFDLRTSFWTTRGYLVLHVNYRGSTSYGRSFCESLRGAWNGVEVEDLLAGVDEVVERGWADPDRLFAGGFSQGAVNTAYLVTRTDRFAAGLAEHGIYDIRSAFGTDDTHKWFEHDYGLPWENPDAYEAASSITDVGDIETPLLLTAGEEDWRCPPTQSEQLYRSLKKRGVDSKLVVYPDEHHSVSDPDRAIHRLETLDEWVARFDPGREAGDVATEDSAGDAR
ncbi:S9 family peptidase [Haloarcula sp. H-GB4]|uniref:S9 family peptidase n=1 Tax=Haloarcula sp. H-GB4 TaxID=3069755 RepID=UPI0027B2177F|nr:S9 family peptidase [Haloarcula sp. H-GB4]MDQ2074014.1 S9 family peptidase [Haloarcula sp. H-GB4]